MVLLCETYDFLTIFGIRTPLMFDLCLKHGSNIFLILGTSYTRPGVRSIKAGVCQRKTSPIYKSAAYALWIMALGIKVLIILALACSSGLGIVVLPAHSQTANAYNCIVVTQECLESRDPVDIMTKLFPQMLPKFG